jgi:hypothetical protein
VLEQVISDDLLVSTVVDHILEISQEVGIVIFVSQVVGGVIPRLMEPRNHVWVTGLNRSLQLVS